jgi:plasmid stabilization system protein ParE
MKIDVSPAARGQIAELAEWWDANRPAAHVRVEDAFEDALKVIAAHPHLGQIYPKRPRYRMWRLRGTPYYLLYWIDDQAKMIGVAAAWSAGRAKDPDLR